MNFRHTNKARKFFISKKAVHMFEFQVNY